MSLAIVTTNQKLSLSINKILSSYFAPQSFTITNNCTALRCQNGKRNKQQCDAKQYNSILHIHTKYYSCTVPTTTHNFYTIPIQSTQQQQLQKSCALIFGFDYNQNIETVSIAQHIQKWCNIFNADSVVIVVNCQSNITIQQQQQWKYQTEVRDCQGTYIPIVYDNLTKIIKQKPQRINKGGLLNQYQEQQPQIFTVIQVIQTTAWPNMVKKSQTKPKKQQKRNEVIKNYNVDIQTKQNVQIQTNPESKQMGQTQLQKTDPNLERTNKNEKGNKNQQSKQKLQQQQQQQKQQQIDEYQMEKQMMQFQMLMSQMMQIKSMPTSNNQRKKKAEDLIMRLAGAMHQ